jgi:hypothetical protein
MLRTLMHSSGEHNALAVNWEAPVSELVSRGNRRVKRSRTESFHDTEPESCQSNTRTALRVSPLFVESVEELGFVIVA